MNRKTDFPFVLCLMGPTSSGKSDLAIALAEHFPLEVINVDSAQVYRGMDIGSGKIAAHIRAKIPHHLMDFLDPQLPYSAAQFQQDAIRCIDAINERGRLPVLVGGTMLYFKALQEGMSPVPATDPTIRAQLQQLKEQKGLAYLYQQLRTIDEITANRLQPTDSQRIQRALEVYHLTGKPLTAWLSQPKKGAPFDFLNIGLVPITTPRAVLHQRIEDRFDYMLAQGLVTEVEKLFLRPELAASTAMRAVGYRQVWEYLEGKTSYDEMRNKAIFATRQLAKRQLTWLRHWPDIHLWDFLDESLLGKMKLEIEKKFTAID